MPMNFQNIKYLCLLNNLLLAEVTDENRDDIAKVKKLIEQKKYAEMLEVLKKVTSKNETKIKEDNRTILFDNLRKDDNFFLNVIRNSHLLDKKDENTESLLQGKNFATFVEYVELLRKYNITDPELHNKFFMANLDVNDFESLIQFDLELFKRIVVDSRLFESDSTTLLYDNKKDEKSSYYLTYQILQKNTLQ